MLSRVDVAALSGVAKIITNDREKKTYQLLSLTRGRPHISLLLKNPSKTTTQLLR
jgi:hypothetical protein